MLRTLKAENFSRIIHAMGNHSFNYSIRNLMPTQSDRMLSSQQQTIHWQGIGLFNSQVLPKPTQQWLLDEGSLTAHLIKKTQGDFAVKLLQQSFRKPTLSERMLLNIPPKQVALIREVVLLCHQQPWVLARSVIPLNSLKGKLNHLRYLKSKPLGHLLFTSPNMTRDPFEVAQININHPLITGNCKHLQTPNANDFLWGRRSKFFLEGKPLSVAEIFLPAFTPWETI